MIADIRQIIDNFQIEGSLVLLKPTSVGLINDTFYLETATKTEQHKYILQQVNTFVFPNPQHVMDNIATVGKALQASDYPLAVLKIIPTKAGADLFESSDNNYWRVFPFIENTYTINKVSEESLAYAAAFSFGEYTRYIAGVDPQQLHTIIPDFHNTPLRFVQFKKALQQANAERKKIAQKEIASLLSYQYLLPRYKAFSHLIRPVHYDTKINNILFDKMSNQPKAIIDLDTLMPGLLPYDFGDMVRTYTPPVDENEKDWTLVKVRTNILDALTTGYLAGLKDTIDPIEKAHLSDGATLIIYEQALRFLGDYLLEDRYYKVEYPDQNLFRTNNQLALLADYLAILGD